MLALINLIMSGYAWRVADSLFEQDQFIRGWICLCISAFSFAIALAIIF
jgi:hypothetical protein